MTKAGKIVLVAALATVLGGAGFVVQLVTADAPQYASVASIKSLPSYQSPALLERAWQLPVAAKYRELLSQSNPSYCGPTSLANVERSLGKNGATPKDVLAGSSLCWTGMCFGGITLDEAAAIARGLGRNARAVRGLSLDDFRGAMKQSNSLGWRYVINFHRGPLFGKGGGHHSPIGGYLEAEDLVFVLDVNQTFQPWLVPTERLWAAMTTIDSSTKQQRGLLVYEVDAPPGAN